MNYALIISVISIVISLTFAIWNYKINRENHEMKKQEFLREKKKYDKEEFDRRPKFEIIKIEKEGKFKTIPDVNCLVIPINSYKRNNGKHDFTYDEKVLNKKDWVSIEFIFKNIGKSTIDHLYVSWNFARSTAMFDVKNDEYIFDVTQKLLNYRVFCGKHIKPNDEITIRYNFYKEYISYGLFSAECSLWLFDEYNYVWEQPLFVHREEIYDSNKKTFKQFRNLTDIEDAIRCFETPNLW